MLSAELSEAAAGSDVDLIGELPPMSRHHVLWAVAVLPDLPRHLTKSLLLLAVYADHRTGLARPGRTAIVDRWDIPWSSWDRHIRELESLGHVRHVGFGNDKTGLAAEYLLCYVSPATSGNPSSHRGGEIKTHLKSIPPLDPGRAPSGENVPPNDPPLTEFEEQMWVPISARIMGALTDSERRRIHAEMPEFQRVTALKRTSVRLASMGKAAAVVEALTHARKNNDPVYTRARAVLPTMWRRLEKCAIPYGVMITDPTPVEPTITFDELLERASQSDEATPHQPSDVQLDSYSMASGPEE